MSADTITFEIEETFKPVVSLTELWMKTVENTTRDFTVNAIKVLSEKYGFPLEEAVQCLGLEHTSVIRKPMTKRTKEEKEPVKEEPVKQVVKKEKKSPVKLSDEEKAEKKAKLEAERAEAKKAREEKEALEKAERAEKRKADLEAKRLEREAKKEAEKAEKEAKKEAEKLKKAQEKEEAEKLKKEQEKKSASPTTKKNAMSVIKIEIEGTTYYLNKSTKVVYDIETKKEVGIYDETNKKLIDAEE